MGKEIWNLLAEYEGRWVAVDKGGAVVAHTDTLPELMRVAEGRLGLTLLYAAPEGELVRS